MVIVRFDNLGTYRRTASVKMDRPCATDVIEVARVLGAFQGGELRLKLWDDSRPDAGRGWLEFESTKRVAFVGNVAWSEVEA